MQVQLVLTSGRLEQSSLTSLYIFPPQAILSVWKYLNLETHQSAFDSYIAVYTGGTQTCYQVLHNKV
jgi:hypothetical protein